MHFFFCLLLQAYLAVRAQNVPSNDSPSLGSKSNDVDQEADLTGDANDTLAQFGQGVEEAHEIDDVDDTDDDDTDDDDTDDDDTDDDDTDDDTDDDDTDDDTDDDDDEYDDEDHDALAQFVQALEIIDTGDDDNADEQSSLLRKIEEDDDDSDDIDNSGDKDDEPDSGDGGDQERDDVPMLGDGGKKPCKKKKHGLEKKKLNLEAKTAEKVSKRERENRQLNAKLASEAARRLAGKQAKIGKEHALKQKKIEQKAKAKKKLQQAKAQIKKAQKAAVSINTKAQIKKANEEAEKKRRDKVKSAWKIAQAAKRYKQVLKCTSNCLKNFLVGE